MNSKKVSEFQSVISNTGLLKYLNTVSISQPTQVQKDCIPKLLGRGNFTVLGRTGSGKTLGFLLPVIDRLKATEKEVTDLKPGCPRAVIIAPTRELALQIFGIAKDISHYSKLRIRKLVGGDKGRTLDNLFSSQMDILVTTPDRCQRAFKNKELRPDSLKYLVLDEADQLLENSFKKTMAEVTELLQNRGRQVFLVSASRPNG
ncbi:MAG: DEAD/DEAH box helicase, partial [Halobacteriovoraceae bacterium]|nr:DEAD/DEAH box helicase [Halobacteriovoraceae bacterium]